MTSRDVERMGKMPEKLKGYHGDQTKNSICGGDERGVRRQRHCVHCMHKVHISYKYTSQRSDEGVVVEVK
jgi:hypothetical protein